MSTIVISGDMLFKMEHDPTIEKFIVQIEHIQQNNELSQQFEFPPLWILQDEEQAGCIELSYCKYRCRNNETLRIHVLFKYYNEQISSSNWCDVTFFEKELPYPPELSYREH